jgi:hypothetical protein
MCAHQGLQLADQRAVPTAREVGINAFPDREQPRLL